MSAAHQVNFTNQGWGLFRKFTFTLQIFTSGNRVHTHTANHYGLGLVPSLPQSQGPTEAQIRSALEEGGWGALHSQILYIYSYYEFTASLKLF